MEVFYFLSPKKLRRTYSGYWRRILLSFFFLKDVLKSWDQSGNILSLKNEMKAKKETVIYTLDVLHYSLKRKLLVFNVCKQLFLQICVVFSSTICAKSRTFKITRFKQIFDTIFRLERFLIPFYHFSTCHNS